MHRTFANLRKIDERLVLPLPFIRCCDINRI